MSEQAAQIGNSEVPFVQATYRKKCVEAAGIGKKFIPTLMSELSPLSRPVVSPPSRILKFKAVTIKELGRPIKYKCK